MIEKLQKEIDVDKEILSTLPQNNKKNKDKYQKSVSEQITKYKSLKDKIVKEMLSRKEQISNKLPKEEKTNDKTKDLEDIVKQYHWFSVYNTSYEKMDFDRILYNLSKNKVTYEAINKTILDMIEKYKEAGIVLELKDFSYSQMFYEYMKMFFKNISDINNKELNDAFEKLYWKDSNIITHIELTFKSLYYKYEKAFDKYCALQKEKLLKDFNNSIIKQYQILKKDSDLEETNIVNIYNKFVNKELNPNDFTKEKIETVMNNYIDVTKIDENNYDDIINEFIKLKHTLEEYANILKYNYIIEDMKKLYQDKDKYKGLVKTKLSEIKKAETKLEDLTKKVYLLNDEKEVKLGLLYKLTKKTWSSKNKNNKEEIIDQLNMQIDNQIIEIKKLYDEYETDKFNEVLLLFNDNSELISLLHLANSFYIYQDKLIEDQGLNTSEVITEINKFIMSPYNTLINNINISANEENSKDIKQIISNKYELSSINISEASLESESGIEQVINDINKIVYYNVINKSNLTVEEILYVYNIDNILN